MCDILIVGHFLSVLVQHPDGSVFLNIAEHLIDIGFHTGNRKFTVRHLVFRLQEMQRCGHVVNVRFLFRGFRCTGNDSRAKGKADEQMNVSHIRQVN